MAKKAQFKRVPAEVAVSSLSPLDITCGSTKCIDDYHCYRMAPRDIAKYEREGVCKDCGEDKVDWARVKKRDASDIDFTITTLQKELIRYVYWNNPIEQEAIELARIRGLNGVRAQARKLLVRGVGKPLSLIYRDGQQTPKTGKEIVHYAQHATATCCRRCLEYWHGIPEEQALTDVQLDYCTALVMEYVGQRVPEIHEEGQPDEDN